MVAEPLSWQARPVAAHAGPIVETDIPARLDRLPWGRFHTLVVVALGVTWILDGLEVTLAGAVAGALRQSPVLQFSSTDIGVRQQRLSGRCGARRNLLRLADRSAGAQEAVLHHACRLPHRHRSHGAHMEFVDLRALPLCDGRRHRRRVHGHQLHHPGADPGARARLDRSRHQRQLLDRRGYRCRRIDHPARPNSAAGRYGLARGIRDRGRAESRHSADAHVASGKPALAPHAWAGAKRPRRSSPASRTHSGGKAIRWRPGRSRKSGCARAPTRRWAKSP